jgi:dipeptidyl aminopeptidase/acylaminoacyl peptidase
MVRTATSRCLLLLAVAAISPAGAQAPRAMSIVDMMNIPSLGDPQISPDGKQLLYELTQADWKANRRVGHIWRVNTDGSGTVQLTNGPRGESSSRWSADGAQIAFIATRGDSGQAQIYLIPNSGGEARPLTNHATSVSNITWSPSGDAIFFLAPEPKTTEERDRDRAKDDVYAFDENYQERHLWRVGVPGGAEQRVTNGDYSILSYHLSRDGKRIAHHRAPNPLLGYSDQGEVWVMNADGSQAVQLTRNTVPEGDATLSPDNSQVLFVADGNDKFETYYNGNIFVQPAGGGQARLLVPDLPVEVVTADWAADGKSVFFVANLGVHSELFRLDLASGKYTQLTDGRHAVQGWSYDAHGRHVLTFDEPNNPGEAWVMQDGGSPTQITHVFADLPRQFKLPRQEKVTWKGADGVTVEGLLYYPVDYREGTRYPLAVQTHGGPRASDKFGFGDGTTSYTPVLTGKGYAVLKPNYRGSTGYGNAFLRDMVGHYYKNAHLDVLAGVDRIIEMGVADSTRMVKMGWSGGGHMTDKIITFTNRFKAAAAGAGAANWISMYAQSDTRTFRTPWFGGTPWQKNAPIDIYWENSPLKYVSNVKTPTIFLVGEQDPRVPMPQSVEMYRALKSNGVPTHLYVAPREPHGWGELRHQLFKMNVELAWFEKYAMGRDYVWEKAPAEEKAPTAGVSSRP